STRRPRPNAARRSETSSSLTAGSTLLRWCACGSTSPAGFPVSRASRGVGSAVTPMPMRPDALETLRLALELLRRIPRKRKVTALELHAQLSEAGFARDLRTVQRQLESLSEHFEIERDDRSKPYGYRWKDRAEGFSLASLGAEESLILALAEQQL